MEFLPNKSYHLYNRGNNRQAIFFNRNNYLYFLGKAKTHILPHADILCYCLMPNHFHFLISVHNAVRTLDFSNSIRTMLSSYTRSINVQEKRSGSLFQQNCKSKEITHDNRGFQTFYEDDYLLTCFNYIHQNPLIAGLVSKMEEWEFSSYRDYIGLRNGTLCNQQRAFEVIDFGIHLDNAAATIKHTLIKDISAKSIAPEKLKGIF